VAVDLAVALLALLCKGATVLFSSDLSDRYPTHDHEASEDLRGG
jgi:hypothetical protein